jgi:stearoyl-CoA desaturase (delta-9 desaturase)
MEVIDEFTRGGLNAKNMRASNIGVYVMTWLSIAAGIYCWPQTEAIHYILLVVIGLITSFGITIGYHRYFTHHSFKCKTWFAHLLLILGTMALTGPLVQWVRTHRAHHHYVEQQGDPHSPIAAPYKNSVLNFLHAHFMWLLTDLKPIKKFDETDQRLLKMVNRSRIAWPGPIHLAVIVMGMLIPGIIAGLWTQTINGALLGILWGGLLRAALSRNLELGINSFCHVFGQRTYETKDNSRDNWFFGIFALGEGWHNSHHKFPYSARHGLKWWQIDISYYVIYLLEKCGVVWDVKLPVKNLPTRTK